MCVISFDLIWFLVCNWLNGSHELCALMPSDVVDVFLSLSLMPFLFHLYHTFALIATPQCIQKFTQLLCMIHILVDFSEATFFLFFYFSCFSITINLRHLRSGICTSKSIAWMNLTKIIYVNEHEEKRLYVSFPIASKAATTLKHNNSSSSCRERFVLFILALLRLVMFAFIVASSVL